jgi:hypothetical protein
LESTGGEPVWKGSGEWGVLPTWSHACTRMYSTCPSSASPPTPLTYGGGGADKADQTRRHTTGRHAIPVVPRHVPTHDTFPGHPPPPASFPRQLPSSFSRTCSYQNPGKRRAPLPLAGGQQTPTKADDAQNKPLGVPPSFTRARIRPHKSNSPLLSHPSRAIGSPALRTHHKASHTHSHTCVRIWGAGGGHGGGGGGGQVPRPAHPAPAWAWCRGHPLPP